MGIKGATYVLMAIVNGQHPIYRPLTGHELAGDILSISVEMVNAFLDNADRKALPPPAPCAYDTDGDGNCHRCVNRGGCKAIGGPFATRE
jgi:hypothetical protein